MKSKNQDLGRELKKKLEYHGQCGRQEQNR